MKASKGSEKAMPVAEEVPQKSMETDKVSGAETYGNSAEEIRKAFKTLEDIFYTHGKRPASVPSFNQALNQAAKPQGGMSVPAPDVIPLYVPCFRAACNLIDAEDLLRALIVAVINGDWIVPDDNPKQATPPMVEALRLMPKMIEERNSNIQQLVYELKEVLGL